MALDPCAVCDCPGQWGAEQQTFQISNLRVLCQILTALIEGIPVVPSGAVATETVSGVASSAADGVLLAANPLRKGVRIHNASTATLYVKLGGAASIASGGYTLAIGPGGSWEPELISVEVIHGIWSAANGFANVTELV